MLNIKNVKRNIARLLIITMLICNSGMMSFADSINNVVEENLDNDKTKLNYSDGNEEEFGSSNIEDEIEILGSTKIVETTETLEDKTQDSNDSKVDFEDEIDENIDNSLLEEPEEDESLIENSSIDEKIEEELSSDSNEINSTDSENEENVDEVDNLSENNSDDESTESIELDDSTESTELVESTSSDESTSSIDENGIVSEVTNEEDPSKNNEIATTDITTDSINETDNTNETVSEETNETNLETSTISETSDETIESAEQIEATVSDATLAIDATISTVSDVDLNELIALDVATVSEAKLTNDELFGVGSQTITLDFGELGFFPLIASSSNWNTMTNMPQVEVSGRDSIQFSGAENATISEMFDEADYAGTGDLNDIISNHDDKDYIVLPTFIEGDGAWTGWAGYSFDGWEDDNGNQYTELPHKFGNTDLTLHARWSKNDTVQYNIKIYYMRSTYSSVWNPASTDPTQLEEREIYTTYTETVNHT